MIIHAGQSTASMTPLFENGFQSANAPIVSTCGEPAQTVELTEENMEVRFAFRTDSGNVTLPYLLPFAQQYSYSFPGDFGTWQIDNLSAPGGFGGGWAFSYLPCA